MTESLYRVVIRTASGVALPTVMMCRVEAQHRFDELVGARACDLAHGARITLVDEFQYRKTLVVPGVR